MASEVLEIEHYMMIKRTQKLTTQAYCFKNWFTSPVKLLTYLTFHDEVP